MCDYSFSAGREAREGALPVNTSPYIEDLSERKRATVIKELVARLMGCKPNTRKEMILIQRTDVKVPVTLIQTSLDPATAPAFAYMVKEILACDGPVACMQFGWGPGRGGSGWRNKWKKTNIGA